MDKMKETIICDDCGAEFTITYNPEDEIEYCPMCGADIYNDEDDDEDEEYWDNTGWKDPDNDDYE